MVPEKPPKDADVEQMLRVNLEQREYYETATSTRGNLATRLWRRTRNSIQGARRPFGISEFVDKTHREWLGDLKGKRVLDLGCYSGNRLSVEIASKCGFYLGLDLSEPAINVLRRKLAQAGLSHARAEAMDFLRPDWPHEPFDIIYARSVMHHFQQFEAFLRVLDSRLADDGRVVAFDPMQTSPAARLVRAAYRPFQSDTEWEWPFTRDTFDLIRKYFHIEAVQGVLGHAKWAIPLAIVPGLGGVAARLGQRWHERDVRAASGFGPGLWRCMQVALLLTRQATSETRVTPRSAASSASRG